MQECVRHRVWSERLNQILLGCVRNARNKGERQQQELRELEFDSQWCNVRLTSYKSRDHGDSMTFVEIALIIFQYGKISWVAWFFLEIL